MIDIHSHLLPELDDGAASIDVSIAMLDALARLGFTTVVATPHLTEPLTDAYADAVGLALATVRPLAAARGIELIGGFEIRLTPDLPARLRAGEPVTLGDSTAVLVDLPLGDWSWDPDDVLFNVQASGFRPVLAHPERYPMMQRRPRYGRELVERGVVLQVTIAAFAGAFGRRVRKTAEALLREGAVQIVATDAHSTGNRLASVPSGLVRLTSLAGEASMGQLTAANIERLLAGSSPPVVEPAPGGLYRLWTAIGPKG